MLWTLSFGLGNIGQIFPRLPNRQGFQSMTQSNRRFMSSMSASAVAPAHQIGIRQRSLRRHCRLGRATELVFILATGLTLVLSGGAEAQTWDGDLDEDFLTCLLYTSRCV